MQYIPSLYMPIYIATLLFKSSGDLSGVSQVFKDDGDLCC